MKIKGKKPMQNSTSAVIATFFARLREDGIAIIMAFLINSTNCTRKKPAKSNIQAFILW